MPDAVQRKLADLTEKVESISAKIDSIHEAVGKLAKRVYIPGPSIWQRVANFLGFIHL